jgi:hypothetical protein
MPATIKIVDGKPVIVGTDSSADLQPSVPEEDAKRKPRPPARRRQLNPFQQLVNDATYEFRQARRDPVRSLVRLAKTGLEKTLNPTALLFSPTLRLDTGVSRWGQRVGTRAVVGVTDNALRMGYSAYQRSRGARRADPSGGRLGPVLDQGVDAAYRALGGTPPSQQTASQRQLDMMGRSFALNAMLAPVTGGIGALRAATMAGKVVRGSLSFGTNEALSQFLDDNTGGGFVDMVNQALGTKLPGGLGDKIGKADPIEAAQATFFGNVVGGQAIGATIGAAARLLPATARRLRQARLKEEEVKARGRLTQGGVIEDSGDGATRPGPAVADAAPQKPPAGFAEADAAMRQRLGQQPAAEPPSADPALQQQLADVEAQIAATNQQNTAAVEGFANPKPAPLPDPLDPAIDPWDDFDPSLPEATDVLKTLDELSPEQIRQLDRTDGPITDPVQRAQEEQAMTPPPQPNPFSQAAAPTDRISQLYLEGAGEVESWSSMLDAVDPVDLRALNDPEASPELVQELVNQRGGWEDATANDIRDALRSLSQQGRTALVERLGRTQTMPVDEIATDPTRFQYKEGVDAQGQQTGASLDGVEAWNPRAEGTIDVWRDPADGKVYVVNGHNRLALARRLGIPSVPVREITASKASAARAFGAIANIAEGQGNAFDAAKFMRESGLTTPEQLKAAGMTGERSWAKDGLALSKLPEDIYRQAIDKEGGMTLRKAVIIGESGLPESGMRMLAGEVRKNPNIPDWELKEIGTMTASSPAAKARQEGIPGMETYGVDEGARAKVRLVRQVEELLKKDAKVFGGVARSAGALEGKAANTIDRAGSKAVAEQSSTALDAFTRLKYQSGEVADRLNRAAQQIADGEQPAAVARQVADEMPAILQREMDIAMGKGAAPTPEANPDQVDLFAPPEQAGPPVEPPPTAAELEGAKMRLVGRAIQNGEARPPTTPIPELSDGPRVRPDDAIADIHARQAIEPGTPGAHALEDEIRLANEQALEDSANRWEAEQQLREAYGYDELTFEEKKALGMIDGWDDPGPAPVASAAAGELQAPVRPERLAIAEDDMKIVAEGWDALDTTPDLLSPERTAQRINVARQIIRRVAGPEVEARFNILYERRQRPVAWGGTGAKDDVVEVGGWYRFEEDLIQVNRLAFPEVSEKVIVETAAHESFHRIQYMALSEKEMKVMDGAFARLKAMIGAGPQDIAYSESQAVAFQRYARAKFTGTDPIAAIFGLPRKPSGPAGAAARVVLKAFDRILDFIERVTNAFKGNGFDSIRGIYNRAVEGKLARTLGEDEVLSDFRMEKIARWRTESANYQSMLRSSGESISALDAQMEQIRQRAAREGC